MDPIDTSPPQSTTTTNKRTSQEFPLSPIDRIRTTIEASIDAGLSPPSSVAPSDTTIHASKTLPLPASSSLLGEEDRPFAKPIRSFTNPVIDAATLTLGKEQESTREEVEKPRVVEPLREEGEEGGGGEMEEQPAIAELPATPLASPDLQSHKNANESTRTKSTKPEDPSVLYNLPLTPSAEAFEVAKQNVSAGYFEPVFPGDDASKTVPPVVEGGRS